MTHKRQTTLLLAVILVLASTLILFIVGYWDRLNIGNEMVSHDHGSMTLSNNTPSGEPDNPTEAYAEAMTKMHEPMIDAMVNSDPDAAFILGMIPHHQGAIDMARVVLRFGNDAYTRKLAEEIITAQEQEIAEMRAWLQQNGLSEP